MVNYTKEVSVRNRISSIDALRAFALLAILLVHTKQLFLCESWGIEFSLIDRIIYGCIGVLFVGRASCIFTILFGISFYLILRKPNYGGGKFVWRCFLLMLIGLAVKIFYWADALMWYGICGMVLVLFRNFSNKKLFISIVILYIATYFVRFFKFGDIIFPDVNDLCIVRYNQECTWSTAFFMWHNGVEWYIRHFLNGGVFYTLANFTIGYMIGKLGWVEIMDKKVNVRMIKYAFLIYMIFLIWSYLPKIIHYPFVEYIGYWASTGRRLSGAFFYSIGFIWLYNNTSLRSVLSFFESYGKLGLTNYVLQSIMGVIILCHFGVAFMHLNFTIILLGAILFYIIQALFSYYWLMIFKNGPMEYLWRCATERKWLPFYRND